MHHETHHETKTFFEKYQTFISIVIAGALIAGGIVFSKTVPSNPGSLNNNQAPGKEEITAELVKTAKGLSLDHKALEACLKSETKAPIVASAISLAEKSGVQGTPTFIIIKRTFGSDNRIVSEKQIPVIGARDKATFMATIENGTAPAGQPPFSGEPVVIADTDHYIGPEQASTIIVEYSDIDCPFCKRAKPTINEILKEHPEYGYVYRHAPIVQLHPFAAYKAEAAECIIDTNGKEGFWKFLEAIAK